jgi:glucose/mannose transport system permease protein
MSAHPALAIHAARRRRLDPARIGVYAFLATAAAVFLLPLSVMLATSLKPLDEIRVGNPFAWPIAPTFDFWRAAWGTACTGTGCDGIRGGFVNSLLIALPSTAIAISLGALNGYALTFWRVRGAQVLFAVLMAGAFVPLQVMIYPLVRATAVMHLFGSLPGIVLVHVIFSMPVMTLLFRNYYASLPVELVHAARVDGAGFLATFRSVILPMSPPIIVVASILQVTGVWNDYLLALVFAGRDNLPMTVQLNNLVNTTTGARLYNVNMAATIFTALVPLALYFGCGRWFVRGIATGALRG